MFWQVGSQKIWETTHSQLITDEIELYSPRLGQGHGYVCMIIFGNALYFHGMCNKGKPKCKVCMFCLNADTSLILCTLKEYGDISNVPRRLSRLCNDLAQVPRRLMDLMLWTTTTKYLCVTPGRLDQQHLLARVLLRTF
jgi:hypothetical protein